MILIYRILISIIVALSLAVPALASSSASKSSEQYLKNLDELSALWSFYKYKYVKEGRVVSLDENHITTSEGQSYAMLRAVWLNDRATFDKVWRWTKRNLRRNDDRLFSWKWKGAVLDKNAATDADSDIALSLIIASNRFEDSSYKAEALEILNDIWNKEVVQVKDKYYITGGNWAPSEAKPTIHVAYLAPYAYDVFASADAKHPWRKLVDSSYEVLNWLYFEKDLKLPPETIRIDKATGEFSLDSSRPQFSYDAFPIFWRVAIDAKWFSRSQVKLRKTMIQFFEKEWADKQKIVDRYTTEGKALGRYEALPLYATLHTLARLENKSFAKELWEQKLSALWAKGLAGRDTPYYLQNWLWFDRADELKVARSYDEFLSFLRPFDFRGFSENFPWVLFSIAIALYFVAHRHRWFKLAFLASAFTLCARYLIWRLTDSLNFIEASGPVLSVTLWIAEFYCFSTVLLLVLQVGLKTKPEKKSPRPMPEGFHPSVDVMIPIYSESCEILEKTLIGAAHMNYANKKIFVCDDSHRTEVRELAERYGATYVKGPKKHAKAGNLNHALTLTTGDLVVIFDTDHIPVRTFLDETVPPFADPKMGIVQTPHHFYNEDIFQRAFGTGTHGKVPNEQDMFNHAIQDGREHWNGSFFVGSGAVFRREAINSVGGFKLLSITEDIHTSQHLHAKGWKSTFVDKDLAVGLTAENLSSYLVQRRRWMQGCLQILFKDNPLFCKGLTIRQKLGYFASLYYFLFPISRVIFWATPLYFLLFHGHPLFAEVSVLVAYLLPYMILLPLISNVLLPGWPRMTWGVVYEVTVSFTLLRGMIDLLLPKSLGFKVTPKGLTSDKRSFDMQSSQINLVVAAITLFAIGKGFVEFYLFGIEKDAYFFNIAWAIYNFLFIAIALLMAWEKPQRRGQDRIPRAFKFTLETSQFKHEGHTHDISLSGYSFNTKKHVKVPKYAQLTLHSNPQVQCDVELVYNAKKPLKGHKCGLKFRDLRHSQYQNLVLAVFSDPETWKDAHAARTQSNLVMVLQLFKGLVHSFMHGGKNETQLEKTTQQTLSGAGSSNTQHLSV